MSQSNQVKDGEGDVVPGVQGERSEGMPCQDPEGSEGSGLARKETCEGSALPRESLEAQANLLPWAVRASRSSAPVSTDGVTWSMLMARVSALSTAVSRRAASSAAPARGAGERWGASAAPALCVAERDRLDVAAAVLAAFSGAVRVIFPHAISSTALADVYAREPFAYWIGPEELTPGAPAERLDLASLEQGGEGTAGSAATAIYRLAEPGTPSICLFTGGSTGSPRLFTKSAQHLLGEAALHARLLGVVPTDRIVATVPPYHVYGLLFSVLLPLVSGAPMERLATWLPLEIARAGQACGATLLVTTPAHARAVATAERLSSLRLIISSGAPLSPPDVTALFESQGVWPIEVYGSTETGGIAVRRHSEGGLGCEPLPGVLTRIDNGILSVKSAYLSSELPRDAAGFYRTPDAVRPVSGGGFLLAGRADRVVKVGATRVDLNEVEERLLSCHGVTDAVALARPCSSWRGSDVVALVVSSRPESDILAEVRARLPAPAWPRVLRSVASIPMTAAGKRDLAGVRALIEACFAKEIARTS